jgi:hypothetical protein
MAGEQKANRPIQVYFVAINNEKDSVTQSREFTDQGDSIRSWGSIGDDWASKKNTKKMDMSSYMLL